MVFMEGTSLDERRENFQWTGWFLTWPCVKICSLETMVINGDLSMANQQK